MKIVPKCIFCEIAAGRSFVRMVHADDDVLCFFPLEPEVLGHTLIVSRKHYHDIRDVCTNFGQAAFTAAQRLSKHYAKVLDTSAFNFMNASGIEAEQSVAHLHFHYLPRFKTDTFSTWPQLPKFRIDLDDLHSKLKF